MIQCDFSFAHVHLQDENDALRVKKAHQQLHTAENPMRLWVDYPLQITESLLNELITCAQDVRQNCEVFVICGIGGSYLGTRAGLDLLLPPFKKPKGIAGDPEILFAGQHLSSGYHHALFEHLKGKNVTVCVVSKSGTTTETRVVFAMLRQVLIAHYGKDYAQHVIAITDANSGELHAEAMREGYRQFAVPEHIGGRYSVLTPVGLFPFAVAGLDIRAIVRGAREAALAYGSETLSENCCYRYALARHLLEKKGYQMEIFEVYEGQMRFFTEWLRQLFAESECKDGKGLFPVAMQMSTDLHSLGQFLQDGRQNFIETVLAVAQFPSPLIIPDQVAGNCKQLDCLNRIIASSVRNAHQKNRTPVLTLTMKEISPASFGELVYFFQKSCAMSAYLSDTNPFDQPGVEAYKAHMLDAISTPRDRSDL